MFPMKTALICLILIYSLICTACPSTRTIQSAKSASGKIATYANTGINITRELFEKGVIPREQTNAIAKAFVTLTDAGIAFDQAIANAEAVYGTNVPKDAVQKLFAVFDASVVAQLLNVLQQIKVISNAAVYAAIIDSLKAAVLIVAGVFDKKNFVAAKLSTV